MHSYITPGKISAVFKMANIHATRYFGATLRREIVPSKHVFVSPTIMGLRIDIEQDLSYPVYKINSDLGETMYVIPQDKGSNNDLYIVLIKT